MRWLIEWWSTPGETVFDPFMGSATTGAAALHLGRKFVGIEIEPRFFEIACKRLEDAQFEASMSAGLALAAES